MKDLAIASTIAPGRWRTWGETLGRAGISVDRIVTVPPLQPGFICPGHLAAQVLSAEDFALNDPFIMLAGTSRLRMAAGGEDARVVFYAGEPQGDPIVSHGPFIGDSREDLVRLYTEFRVGKFERMSHLARARHYGGPGESAAG